MRLTSVEIEWGGETRTFDLKLRGQRAVEEKCKVGLGNVLGRLWTGLAEDAQGKPDPSQYRFYVDDYREVILQGLIDGGMKQGEAQRLVMSWVDDRPSQESVVPAVTILSAWLYGVTPAGKTKTSGTNSETATAPTGSTSTRSTELVQ